MLLVLRCPLLQHLPGEVSAGTIPTPSPDPSWLLQGSSTCYCLNVSSKFMLETESPVSLGLEDDQVLRAALPRIDLISSQYEADRCHKSSSVPCPSGYQHGKEPQESPYQGQVLYVVQQIKSSLANTSASEPTSCQYTLGRQQMMP